MSNLTPSSIHNKLRKLTSHLDKRLIKLEKSLFTIQKQVLRFKKDFPPAVPQVNMLSRIEKLRSLISTERRSLQVLKRSKPGFLAAIVDFVYNWTISSRSPSQKEKYLQNLKQLNELQETESLGSQMGADPISEVIKLFYNKYKPDNKIDTNSFRRILGSLMSSERAIQDLVNLVSGSFENKNNAKQAIHDIVVSLERHLTTLHPENQVAITSKFDRIRQYLGNVKTAGAEDFEQFIQKTQAHLEGYIIENNNFKNRLEEITNNIGKLPTLLMSRDDLALIQKYQSYISELLSSDGNGIQAKLLQLRQEFDRLQVECEKMKASEQVTQNPIKSTPEVE
jgi:hypothetical protein